MSRFSYTPGPWGAKFDEDAMRWTVRAPLGENVPRPRSAVSSGWDKPIKTFELCRLSGNRPNAEADAIAISQLLAMCMVVEQLSIIALNFYIHLRGQEDEEFVRYEALMGPDKALCESVKYWLNKASDLLNRIKGEDEK